MCNMVNCVGAYPASAANTCLFGVMKQNRENQSGLVTLSCQYSEHQAMTTRQPPTLTNPQSSECTFVLCSCTPFWPRTCKENVQGFTRGRHLQDFKSVCKHTNLDCRTPKNFNTQFLLPLNKWIHTLYADNLHTKCIINSSWQLVGQQGILLYLDDLVWLPCAEESSDGKKAMNIRVGRFSVIIGIAWTSKIYIQYLSKTPRTQLISLSMHTVHLLWHHVYVDACMWSLSNEATKRCVNLYYRISQSGC